MGKVIIGIYWLIFGLGLWVEDPGTQRLGFMALLGAGGFAALCPPLHKRLSHFPKWNSLLWLMAPAALLLLERQSKYSINDFFHMLYFMALLSLYHLKDEMNFRWAAPLMGAALLWKYLYIALLSPELFRIPQMVVALSLYGLVAVILWLGLKLSKEQLQMQHLNEALEERQILLTRSNDQLAAYMDEAETLTVYRERQKMAREIHDTVGHELTALTMKLELSKYFSAAEPEKSLELLDESIEDSRRALRATRQVVTALTNSRRSGEDLHQLVSRYELGEGLDIHLEGASAIEVLGTEESHAVYRAVQEAMTNCLKHSDAANLWISLSAGDKGFDLKLWDDGTAIRPGIQIAEGFGLAGMRERVTEAGGSFAYQVAGGFTIEIHFPDNKSEPEEARL